MTVTNNPFIRPAAEARGFALYVGIDEATAKAHGTNLAEIVLKLRLTLNEIVPGLADESFAAVALAKAGCGGRHVDVVKAALANSNTANKSREVDRPASGVVIDLARRKIFVDGQNINPTEKEFELVRFLLEKSGQSVSRQELLGFIWGSDRAVSSRTVDVHIRRLRVKLGIYQGIVRTTRCQGYCFDRHPDVLIEQI